MKASIRIPRPCHEDWNGMEARNAGRFCHSCAHTVMDLSRHSDAQLLALLRSDAMPKCARFSRGQLDRVIALDAPTGPRLLPAAALGSMLALQATVVAAQDQQPKPLQEPIVEMELGEVEVVRYELRGLVEPDPAPVASVPPPPAEDATDMVGADALGNDCAAITGCVIGADGDAIPFANIFAPDLKRGTVSAMDGTFRLVVPDSLWHGELSLSIAHVGYRVRRIQGIPMHSKVSPAEGPAAWEGAALTVRVLTDAPEALAGISATLNGSAELRKPDAKGFIAFEEPNAADGGHVVLVRDGGGILHRTLVPREALPCCVLVDLRTGAGNGEQAEACGVDLGDVVLHTSEIMIMGELVSYVHHRKPTAWSRATRPFRWVWWKARTAFH